MKQNKEDFLTGVGAVDAEHVVLLDLTDQVGALLADENMLFKCADIRQLLKRLEDYTTMHFTHEEQLMEKMGYGGIEDSIGCSCRSWKSLPIGYRSFRSVRRTP